MILYVSDEQKGKINGSLISFEPIVSKYPKKVDIKGIKIDYSGQPLVIAPLHKLFSFGAQKSKFDDNKYSMTLVLKEGEPLVRAVEVIERECETYLRNLPDRPRPGLENPLKTKDGSKRLVVKITPSSRFYDLDRSKIDYKDFSFSCDVCPSLHVDSMYIVDGKAYIQFKIDEAVIIPRTVRTGNEDEELTLDLSRLDLS